MIRDGNVFVTALARSLDHFLRGIFSVTPRCMHVKIAANVFELNDARQFALGCGLHLAPIFTKNGRDVWQTQFVEDLSFLKTRDGFAVGIEVAEAIGPR